MPSNAYYESIDVSSLSPEDYDEFEALLNSKKCLVFGHAWYKRIHGCFFINNKTTNSEINNFINNNRIEVTKENLTRKISKNTNK